MYNIPQSIVTQRFQYHLYPLSVLMLFLIGLLFFPMILSASSHYARVKVDIQGLNKDEGSLISSNLSIKAAEQDLKLHQDRIESLHQLAPEEISHTLEALGFYHSQVRSHLSPTPEGFLATYQIEKGPPTYVETYTVQLKGDGQYNKKIKKIAAHTPFSILSRLKHEPYELYKQELLSTALQEGYLDAEFIISEIRVNKNTQRAEIIIVLETGNRYTLGKVHFKDPPLPLEFLRKTIPFSEGEPYTTARILACQKALTDTDLFKRVQLDPKPENAEDYAIPIQIRLKMRPKNKYAGSLGYGTDIGPRGMLGWEHRLKHYPGHRINAEVQASQRLNQINLRYSLPGKNPITDRIIFGVKEVEERTRDKKFSRLSDISASYLQKKNRWDKILSLNYLKEIYRDFQSDPKKESHFLLPSMGFFYKKIVEDSALQQGFRIGLIMRGAARSFLSSTDFAQAELRLKSAQSLGDKTRLLCRLDLGTTHAGNFNKIPYSLRFFTGGDQTVRGYGYKTLGPRQKNQLGNDVIVGGRHLIVGSAELERIIYKQLSGAAFVDSGQAMNRWKKNKLATGAGVGIRYATPLGPLRLDVAKPLSKGYKGIRIHITFGMDL
jgi:translocation and assembly module TamA